MSSGMSTAKSLRLEHAVLRYTFYSIQVTLSSVERSSLGHKVLVFFGSEDLPTNIG